MNYVIDRSESPSWSGPDRGARGRVFGPLYLSLLALVAIAVLAFSVNAVGHAAGGSIASADAGGCKDIETVWTVDADGVTQVTGDMPGTIEITSFVPGDFAFPFLEFTGTQVIHTSSGDAFASMAGTFNVLTAEVDFISTTDGGTGRWAGATSEQHVVGVDLVGGTSDGYVCVGKSEWDNGHRNNL